MAERIAEPDYASRVAAVAVRIAGAVEQSAVLGLLREGTSALGAERAVLISFVRDAAETSACRFLLACDPGWSRQYLETHGVAHDPWLRYAAGNTEPVLAGALAAEGPDELHTVQLAEQFGFASTVLVPAHSGAGHSRVSVLYLGSSIPGYLEGDGLATFCACARMLTFALHDWWVARMRRELVAKARITSDDLVLLRHQHKGHSSKRIAATLQVSEVSINSRFQRLNAKLGVASRRQAARLAAEYGLIAHQPLTRR